MPADTLPTIVSFWHGPLSWLERLCAHSFVRNGHRVELYSYDHPGALPNGVEWRDAAEILPRDKLVFYKGRGTPGVFSDYFRMSLLKAGRGIWADLDVYCVRPIDNPPEYLFGYERDNSINGAVLLIPADAPLLDDLLAVFTETRRPIFEPHLPPFRRLEVAAKRLLGMQVPPEHMQYGATGPFALTHYVRQHNLEGYVRPREVFYPVAYEDIPTLTQPGSRIEDVITPRTLAVHIWRSQLTNRGRADMPLPAPDSALERLCEREGIALDRA